MLVGASAAMALALQEGHSSQLAFLASPLEIDIHEINGHIYFFMQY
jgi:hypothetical protein